MQSATVRRPSLPWWIVLLIGIGLGAGIMAAVEEADRLPWVLEEKPVKGNPYRWDFVERLPTKAICQERGRRRMARTGRPWRCRYDGP